jgi:hypothetical protein
MLTPTDRQKLVEGWVFALLQIPTNHEQVEEVNKLIHMARLGAWYHKHQVLIENVLHTAISEMEGSNHPQFIKAIDSIRQLLREKPQE